MEQVNKIIAFLQNNWVAILLVIAGLISLLKAIVHFRINWAKTTPDKADDESAKLFAKRVNVFISFFKELFRIKSKKSKDDAGFLQAGLGLYVALFLVGAIVGALLFSRFGVKPQAPAAAVPVAIPAVAESDSKSSEDNGSKSGKKTVIKEYNCPDGGLSKEISVDAFLEQKHLKELEESSKKQDQLVVEPAHIDILYGAGLALKNVESLRDLNSQNVKLQGAVGLDYTDTDGGYSLLTATDGHSNHNIYGTKKWRLK